MERTIAEIDEILHEGCYYPPGILEIITDMVEKAKANKKRSK